MSTATAAPPAGAGSDGRRRGVDADLVARLALVAVAAAAALLRLPTWAVAVLVVAATVTTAEGLVRRRALGAVDALAVAVGGLLALLALLGSVLALTDVRPVTRVVVPALAAVAVLGLVVERRRTAPPPAANRLGHLRGRDALLALPAAAVLALAVLVPVQQPAGPAGSGAGGSAAPSRAGHGGSGAAPLSLAVPPLDGPVAHVTVRAGQAGGPYEVRVDVGDGTSVSYPVLDVTATHPVTVDVTVPRGRSVISLHDFADDAALRSVTVVR